MIEKLFFIIKNYSCISMFAYACYGYGKTSLNHLNKSMLNCTGEFSALFNCSVAIVVGLAGYIVFLQTVSISAFLNVYTVFCFLFIGLVLAFNNTDTNSIRDLANRTLKRISQRSIHDLFLPILVLFVFLDLVLRPLRPPVAWDEVMYHLPHAQHWVDSGKLQVNQWLRYPYFPFNVELIFTTGILFDNYIFAHLIQLLAGLLASIGIYQVSKTYFNQHIGCIGILIFVYACMGQFTKADVDLVLTLYIFFSFISVFFWYQTSNTTLQYISALFLGVALGSKYQALIYLPLYVALVTYKERSATRYLRLFFIVLIPCAYWYIRNYIITGNPINPLAGEIFGYWDWTQTDMSNQMADIVRVKNWPVWFLWPALGALFIQRMYLQPFSRLLIIFSIYAVSVWLLTSHYSRYLMPAYPIISVLSAIAIYESYTKLRIIVCKSKSRHITFIKLEKILISFILFFALASLLLAIPRIFGSIPANNVKIDKYLTEHVESYEIGKYLKRYPDIRIMQFDLESDILYLPLNTVGEIFGPGRYSDSDKLNSSELANKMQNLHLSMLLVKQSARYDFLKDANFRIFFDLEYQTDKLMLYKLKSPNQ